eukprot:7700776-Karenia_brevis.AAC.1
MILDFQVAEVSKPLLAVKRIVEKGNRVAYGPGKEDNFILNSKTGDKVNFVGGGPTEIAVDSGAEESVCPWEWGEQSGCRNSQVPVRLRAANGAGQAESVRPWLTE